MAVWKIRSVYMTFNVFTVFVRMSSYMYSMLFIYDMTFNVFDVLVRMSCSLCCFYMAINIFTVFVRIPSNSILFVS